MKMPTLFIGHGSPMNAISENEYTQSLCNIRNKIPKPRGILMVSAHWETKGSWVTGMDKPRTIHDFFGFPDELFKVQYPAPGDAKLSEKLSEDPLISIDKNEWGLDHGTWAVLLHLFPEADIPVVQLSMDMTKPLSYHYELGEKLNSLREEGILIMGSGNIVHNLKEINWDTNAPVHEWTQEFDQWVKGKISDRDFQPLINSPVNTSSGKLSIPTWDHYLPLLYVLGASDLKDQLTFDYEGFQNASMSMRCLRFS